MSYIPKLLSNPFTSDYGAALFLENYKKKNVFPPNIILNYEKTGNSEDKSLQIEKEKPDEIISGNTSLQILDKEEKNKPNFFGILSIKLIIIIVLIS